MRRYFRMAQVDGRDRGAADAEQFYLFASTAVRDMHHRRVISGNPPAIEEGVWFRLFNGIVVDAVTGERYSEADSATELYDITPN